jgi:hypothetical protein
MAPKRFRQQPLAFGCSTARSATGTEDDGPEGSAGQAGEEEDRESVPSEGPSAKRSKPSRSGAWEHFEVVQYEGTDYAQCQICWKDMPEEQKSRLVSERVFSGSGRVLTKERASMKGKTLEALMILKSLYSYLQD